MKRLKLGFWLVVLVALMLPTSGETRTKRVYKADIKSGANFVGSGIIGEMSTGYDHITRTNAYPDYSVTRVSLVPEGGGWEVTLCENGGPSGDCTYKSDGNLDVSGAITPTMLFVGGATGSAFSTALRNGRLYVLLNGGTKGSGVYIRII